MDVLSDAISVMRAGRPHADRHELRAPWGMRFPSSGGAGFHTALQGSCWLLPPGGEPIMLGTGDVVFLHGEGSHAVTDSPGSPLKDFELTQERPWPCGNGAPTVLLCGSYVLDTGRMHPLLAEVPPVLHLPAHPGNHPRLHAAVDLLGGELERPRPGAGTIVSALLDTLLLYMLRAWFEERAKEAPTGWTEALTDPAISTALSAMHQAPDRPWTVAELAARAGLSRAAFAKRFTALIGKPPLAYLTWWRMTIATRLLRESDKPLRTVARQTGYTSDIAFAAAFKREHGITPGRYRAADKTGIDQ